MMSNDFPVRLVHVDPSAHASISAQLRSQLEWLIARGVVSEGDQLPAIRGFAEHLGVNFNTLRGVYKQLEHDGYVLSERGRGTTVLNYRQARGRTARTASRSFSIGVIIPTHLEFYTPFLNTLDSSSSDPSLLFICVADGDPNRGLSYMDQLIAKQVDGVIVAGAMVPDDIDMARIATPTVFADYPGAPGPCVLFDHEQGSFLVTAHLLEHGHRRVGFVTPPLGSPAVEPKHRGFLRATRAAGLTASDVIIETADDFGVEPGYASGLRLLSRSDRPTGVATASDSLAIGVLRAARELGIAVPDELAIVGNDNVASGQDTAPPLTTVDAPAAELGSESIIMLEQLIAGHDLQQQVVTLTTHLVPRRSCGCH